MRLREAISSRRTCAICKEKILIRDKYVFLGSDYGNTKYYNIHLSHFRDDLQTRIVLDQF